VFVTAGLAGLIGLAIESRTTYRVTRVLEVSEGAPAEAVFVCRSRDVLATAMEKAGIRQIAPLEELADQVTVEEAGGRRLHLTVERRRRQEAEGLAAAIAEEASGRVRVIARKVTEEHREKADGIVKWLAQVRANRDNRLAELDELKRKHPEEIDEQGRPLGTAQKRLISVQDALAEARRELAAMDARIESLRTRVESTPRFTDPAGTTGGTGACGRLKALDEEIAGLRKDLTDRHPRLAALLAERADIEVGSVLKTADLANPLRLELEVKLSDAEAERSAAAARARKLEEDVEKLRPLANDSVTLGEIARSANEKLRRHEAEIEDMRRGLDRVRREAEADATAHAALVDVTKRDGLQARVLALRADAPPGRLALLGAGLGLMLGVLLAALAESMDPVLRTAEDIRRILDMPVLATVPNVSLTPRRPGRPRSRARVLGGIIWLAAFLLAAAFLLGLVYRERLGAMFGRERGRSAPEAGHEVEEVLP
jgi:hypothetical protein